MTIPGGGRPTRPSVTVAIPTRNRAKWLLQAVESVLAQTYEDFQLLICDNASEDETAAVIADVADDRVRYVRSEQNIGMIANCNRAVELATTDLVIVVPDDDLLRANYLAATVPLLERSPTVGVVHTGHEIIDSNGHELPGAGSASNSSPLFERGEDFIRRTMSARWGTICWTSALFRREAFFDAGGLRADEQPFPDVPLFLRVALKWDVAHVPEPLVAVRAHANSETAQFGVVTTDGYEMRSLPELLLARRLQFIDRTEMSDHWKKRHRALARRAIAKEEVGRLADDAVLRLSWIEASRGLLRVLIRRPDAILLPRTWRFVVAHAGARAAKRRVGRLAGGTPVSPVEATATNGPPSSG